jgi:hypothetical protein
MSSHEGHNHEEHSNSLGHNLLLASGVGTAAVVAAPYIGNFFGIGNSLMEVMMPSVAGVTGFHSATGLALAANNFLKSVPLVGETLAAGGLEAAAISGVIGIGGMFLGNYIQKNYDVEGQVPWGKIIKYTCLATSMLIALPSLLTGISVGLSYLAGFTPFLPEFSTIIAGTLGSMGMTHGAATGAMGMGSLLVHFFTCGGAALSAVGAVFLDKDEKKSIANLSYNAEHSEQMPYGNVDNASPLAMEVVSCTPIIRGQECYISFRLMNEKDQQLSENSLRETHTKKLHVMIVDNSLVDYHHLHPQYDTKTGLFTTSFVPKIQAGYSAWHDFELQNGESFVLKNDLPASSKYNIQPVIQHSQFVSAGGFNMKILATPPLQSGANSTLTLQIRDLAGNPVKLEEIMGASGHLVAFSKDKKDYIHCHPLEEISKNGDLIFHVMPAHAGFGKFFLGIKIDGQEVTIPFGQYIQPKIQMLENNSEKSGKPWVDSTHLQPAVQAHSHAH